MTWRCEACKGDNVQRACWVNPNTLMVHGQFGDHEEHEHGQTWCDDCRAHTPLVSIEHAADCDMEDGCACADLRKPRGSAHP
jgi:hypothetical protein